MRRRAAGSWLPGGSLESDEAEFDEDEDERTGGHQSSMASSVMTTLSQ
jgi:hypothetical protein